ncbi:outer membrane beta-barrel protein [Bryobacter aggregatus]|uniref:outer membrane beta-barrel protein n=1 Tax=Bryobacter aggregatus TaxID=360054 RepID=UPI0009B5B114|nr:outer membrane beta-barrel protein [Bryobacter aggregatus]
MRKSCIHTLRGIILSLGLLAALPAMAQRWEFGAGAAGTFYTSKDVSTSSLKASAGFNNGFGFSAWLGNDMHKYLGGEIRYMYQNNDLKLQQGGTTYTFGSRSNTIHYDFLLHTAPRGSRLRPFVAFGAGFRGYEGTGREVAVQPLNNFAFLTKTKEWVPVVSVGAGIKFMPVKHLALRAEFRDYISPVPTKVIAPAPGAKLDGWFQNFVAQFGVSILF